MQIASLTLAMTMARKRRRGLTFAVYMVVTICMKKIVSVAVIITFLLPHYTLAGTREVCLAPVSALPAKGRAVNKNKYQLILERFKGSNPDCNGIPEDKFVEFIRDAESLFEEYRSYSRFPFNPQVAVQFAENKRSLIHEVKRLYIEALGHVKKKDACARREGMRRLEEAVKSKLSRFGYTVVDLMGRPGVGKSTIAGKMKKGFAGLRQEEILVIPVDGFRNNDVSLVNQLISRRDIINAPLKELKDNDYEFLRTVSKSLQFPLLRDSDRSFLDFYLVAEEREHETGENKRYFRRRKLWNHIGTNPRLQRILDMPFRLMSKEDYDEIIRIGREMRLNTDRMGKDSGKSFSDIYEEIDNEELLEGVEKREKAAGDIKLFVVEGTYSYQGEKIFDPDAERLMKKDPDSLIKVMIDLDEDIRQQRIRDRHRSDMEEMLILRPVFDAIFMGSVDLERNSSDLIIDNTESTDLFQIKQTHSGIKAQFGIISETARTTLAREIFEKEPPPDIYVLPPELFKGGRSYADIEFLMYYNYFIKGRKRISLVGTSDQIERIKIFLQESLFGPDPDNIEHISSELKKFIRNAAHHFAVKDETGKALPLEGFIDFHIVDIGQKCKMDIKKDNRTISVEIEHIRAGLFSIREEGYDPDIVEVDYREPPETNYNLTPDQQIALQNARHNTFAVTPMGSEDGFTPAGDYPNFITWLGGTGIHVDPSPRSLIYLEQAGIDPDDIPYILLTHNHADHDSGLIRKILMKKRIKLLTTRPIYESFIKKAKALIGEGFAIEDWIDWIELSEENTNEISLPNGQKAYIDIRYNLHSIPTIGFVLSYKDKRFGYSGDTLYNPEMIEGWFKDGRLTNEQADKLLYFFWDENGEPKVDLLFHEAGIPPIHTRINKLCGIPEKIYERLRVVHLSPARLRDRKELEEPLTEDKLRHFAGLRQPELFGTEVLIPADESAEKQILSQTLDNVGLLKDISPEAKMDILRCGLIRTFNPGDPIIFEGDKGDTFYIILSGTAEVIAGGEKVTDAGGKEWLLGGRSVWSYYPKDSFGEVSLIDDKPRTASVVAVSSLRVIEIRKEDFLNLVYTSFKEGDSQEIRRLKYCIEEWIQRYSESLIDNISDINLTEIARHVKVRYYPKGEKIIKQGDKADTAYVILEGSVDVFRDGMLVATPSFADIFGEIALLDKIKKGIDAKRNADCIAKDEVQVLVLSMELLDRILHLYPGLDRGLTYEYRKRLLPHSVQYPSPHKYMVARPQRAPVTAPRAERERILERERFRPEDMDKLRDEEKIVLFLNDIFGDMEFYAPEEFSDEFYNPSLYRGNFIRFTQCLGAVFTSFQIQRFYHKFIEVSVYDEQTKTKTIYRFARNREKNVYRWSKESEVEIVTDLPNRPVDAVLINLESEKYQGVKGTPENVKTLQSYLEMYNPNCNLSLIDCQWPENSIDFIVERIKVEQPEMVSVSSTFGCLKELERLIVAIRKMPYKPLVIIGGLTATWSYEYLLEKYPEVICVQKEGEEALSGLADLVYQKGIVSGKAGDCELMRSVPNLIYIDKGRVKENAVKKVDLSKAPHPSRSSQITRMKDAGFLLNAEGFGRGCGYGHCAFCTRTHGRLRPLPSTRVKGDFEEYMYGGAGFIVYADEDFIPDDPGKLNDFIAQIEALKEKYRNDYFLENGSEPKDISFYVAARARCIWKDGDQTGNEERSRMLERLKRIGLVKIFLGVESGSSVQLKKTYNKEGSLLEMKNAIKVIRGLGIQVVTGFITFDPVVTLGQLEEDIRFVRELGLVKTDPLTEPINPFKQYRAQIGSPLVSRYRNIGLLASDHNPGTLIHDVVYRSKSVNMIMNIGSRWDEMISLLEYSLKGVVWHAEQSAEETERAGLFIDLFNWFRERGYLLLEELCGALSQNKEDRDLRIDRFFDSLSGLSKEKILFELRRAIFPHEDIYRLIESYIDRKNFNGKQIIAFLKEVFKGKYPNNWTFTGDSLAVFNDWIEDIARDISLQVMSDEEMNVIKNNLNEIFKRALMERINRLRTFKDANWRFYYSANADLVERGIEFSRLLEDAINEHSKAIAGLAESRGAVSYEENPGFRIYHKVSLKEYFKYRHPDISEPLGVLIKLRNMFESQKKAAKLDKVFLYADGTLKCDDLRCAGDNEIIDVIRKGLKQIYFSSYNPFKKYDKVTQNSFQDVLYKEQTDLGNLGVDLNSLYSAYASYYKKDIKEGSSISYTNRNIAGVCSVEIISEGNEPFLLTAVGGNNEPGHIRWEIPKNVYTLPLITKEFSVYIASVVKQLLGPDSCSGTEEYRRGVMIVNALAHVLALMDDQSQEKTSIDWLGPICDIFDDTVLPLTVYLPDNDEGRKIAESAKDVPVIFVYPAIYERVWPGISPHLEDIILLATPGILDDFPKALELVKSGRLRPELIQLIYELFHNKISPDVYIRNEKIDEIVKYTSNSMRVMPRKTPVLLLPPDNPLLTRYVSDKLLEYMTNPEGKIRILLHPYTYKKWLEEEVSFPRPDTELEWTLTYPTASHRTLFILGKDRNERLIGKVHSIIWAGPAMRRLKPDAVEHSYLVSERIRKPVDKGELPESIKEKFGYFTEQGFAYKDRALYPEGIGVLYRSAYPYPETGKDEVRFLMPTFSAHNNAVNVPDNTSDTPLTQLIDWNTSWTGEDPIDYFVREILKPLYDIYFYYMFEQGFLLEPHGQNFFFEVDTDGKIRRLIFKDWQSTMVDMGLRERLGLSKGNSIVKHLLGVEASEATSLSIVFDYYWGTYLMRQLLEVLVKRYHGDREKTFYRQLLLKRFKDVFSEDYNKYPASHSEFSDISLGHGKKPLSDKTNMVPFAANGAPLLRPTAYERKIEELTVNPALRKGKVIVPVTKIVDENAVIQRQEYLPDEMVIDFDRARINDNFIAVYPENYDPGKKYNLLIALHGKGSHPARLMDIPEKIGTEDTIIVIPKAPFSFGTGYTWFIEGEEEQEMKAKSADFIKEIINNFKQEGRINDNVHILGISEGGYTAYLFGMRFPAITSGIIALNAPFRENYFTESDIANVRPDGYPDIFIIQYDKDKIVAPANSQRAESFYRSKGLEPKVQYYSSGSHHRISVEMAEDINKWMRIRLGEPPATETGARGEIFSSFKEEEATAKMVERIIPMLLLLLPDGNTMHGRVTRERFSLIASSLCQCLFQIELRIKDSSTKTDPALIDTVKWLGKEAKFLLEELMEMRENDAPKGDISLEINNIDRNKKIFSDLLGRGKREILIRVPIQTLSGIEKNNAARFLGALQNASNCYIELYSAEGAVDADEAYKEFQKLPPKEFVKTRENTITLFVPPDEGELTPGVLLNRLGEVGLQPIHTILSPIGLRNDPVGLINSAIMGFRLMSIARNKNDSGFISETSKLYGLTDDDLISLAVGDINDVIKTLKKLIKLLPIKRYDPNEIEEAYKHAEAAILTAA